MAARVEADDAYPSANEFSSLQVESRGADAAKQRADSAREAVTMRNQLLGQAQRAVERADDWEAQVPAVERSRVRERWALIDADLKIAEKARGLADKSLAAAQTEERAAHSALQSDERSASALETEIRVNASTARDQREQAATLKSQVREDLRPDPLTDDAIGAFVTESAELKPLADLIDDVNAAPTEAAKLQGQRESVRLDMAKVPDEDRRDPDVAEAEWHAAGAELSSRQGELRKAESDLEQARQAADKARGLETSMLAARTREEDAKLLESLLGVQQLQGKLVEAARIGITDAANRELDAISRGNLRLEMHRKVKRNGEEAELELLVLDRAAVREPIDAAYLSGSQRFRVAVALALGIGQYVGGAARGQRAVIIDEGFGSLDADGIDAMAEHLRDLSDRLDRVILVTHQAEMRKHFEDGFVIRRKNGTSQVEPWCGSKTTNARANGLAAVERVS
jgi:DNA repair exonuclease SbcCD ATPase subunit